MDLSPEERQEYIEGSHTILDNFWTAKDRSDMDDKSVDIDALLEERGENYGDYLAMHEAVAKGWEGIFAIGGYTPQSAALAMVYLKMLRDLVNPKHPDNRIDIQGYLKLYENILTRLDLIEE